MSVSVSGMIRFRNVSSETIWIWIFKWNLKWSLCYYRKKINDFLCKSCFFPRLDQLWRSFNTTIISWINFNKLDLCFMIKSLLFDLRNAKRKMECNSEINENIIEYSWNNEEIRKSLVCPTPVQVNDRVHCKCLVTNLKTFTASILSLKPISKRKLESN